MKTCLLLSAIFVFSLNLIHSSIVMAKTEEFKIQKENLVLGTKAVKNENAVKLYEKAIEKANSKKRLDTDISYTGHPGWWRKETVDALKEVIRKYPDSESAVSAQLRLALILVATEANIEWGNELFEEIEKKRPETWQGLCARYLRTIWRFAYESHEDEIKKILKDMLKIEDKIRKLKLYKKNTDFKDFEVALGFNDSFDFESNYYTYLSFAYCKLSNFEKAIDYAQITIKISSDPGIISTEKKDIEVMKNGKCPYGFAQKRVSNNDAKDKSNK